VSLGGHLAYLEDPPGTLTLAQVAALPPERFTLEARTNPNFGLTASSYWLRFSLERDPADARRWYLEVGYPLLDAVELYLPRPRGGFERRIAGDQLPFAQRELHDPTFFMALPPQLGKQPLYVRVQSQSSLTVPLQLLSERAVDELRSHTRLALALLYGAMLALALYNLLLYISTRERAFLVYVLFVAAAGLAQFTYNGLAYQFLWPEAIYWNDRAPNVLGLLALALGLRFTRSVLGLREHAPRLDAALNVLAGVSVVFALLGVGPISYAAAVRAFSVLAPVSGLAMLASGAICALRGYRPARLFLLAWSALLAGVLVHSMRLLGLVPANLGTLLAIQIGSATDLLLLSFALADRINTLKLEKQAAQAQALEAARRSERELEVKVQQRVADLAALNQALQIEVAERRNAEKLLARMAHHDPLTGLPNRLLLRDRFDVAAANARRNHTGLGLLLIDLDEFKQVNDTFGHEAGDQLLTAVGEKLRGCVRESDTVARLGGDEFVVLLGNLGAPDEESAVVAEKILERLSASTLIAGQAIVVTPSIGVAVHPRDGEDLAACLRCADRAMYEAKQQGGRGVRFSARERAEQYRLGLQ
jgi:diguanylate cyclase (GGDEF)-like protein